MGKKRIITKNDSGVDKGLRERSLGRTARVRIESGVLHVHSTFNNTQLVLTDSSGNAIAWSSSGSLGFKGAKKGTPFAAGKMAELLADRSQAMGLKEIDVVVKGVGAGREAAIRAFSGKGLLINSIKDTTPVPFNGPKPKKPRRV